MSTGDAAQVTCLVSQGDQPLDISWKYEGKSINSLPGVSTPGGGKASMLLIDAVSPLHRGNYTCTVKNSAGTVNFTAVLRINGNCFFFVLFKYYPK